MIDLDKLHKTILNKKEYYIDEFLINSIYLAGYIQLGITKLILVEISDKDLFRLFLPRLEKRLLEQDIKIEYIREESAMVSYGKQRKNTLIKFIDLSDMPKKSKGYFVLTELGI